MSRAANLVDTSVIDWLLSLMISRLVALWFSILVMCLSSAACFVVGTEYYHVYQYKLGETSALPAISRLFLAESGWINFYPGGFIIAAALLTWRGRERAEWLWCAVALTLASTILFLSLFYMAVELPQIPAAPRLMAR